MLIAADRIRPRRGPASPGDTGTETADADGMSGLFIALPHWRSDVGAGRVDPQGSDRPARPRILLDCLESLLSLQADREVIAVLTNDPTTVANEIETHLKIDSDTVPVETVPDISTYRPTSAPGRKIVVVGWRPHVPRNHGHFLTWAHKDLFRDALRDRAFSHFIYLEDDLRITQETLSYWFENRASLAEHGLLPGFVRFELNDGSIFIVDQVHPQVVRAKRVKLAPTTDDPDGGDGIQFVALANPYQAMYVLDRELAVQHFRDSPARSPLRSTTISRWNTRERASIGPSLDAVPPPFLSRNVVPFVECGPGDYRLDPCCLVEHISGNYSLNPASKFGKLRLEDLFRYKEIETA